MVQQMVLSALMCCSLKKQSPIELPELLTCFTFFFLQRRRATDCHSNCVPEFPLESALLLSKVLRLGCMGR